MESLLKVKTMTREMSTEKILCSKLIINLLFKLLLCCDDVIVSSGHTAGLSSSVDVDDMNVSPC